MASVSSSPGRVLVTGVEGFTGAHLTPELVRRGYEVIGHMVAACDLRDQNATHDFVREARPDFVIHLAAISFVAHGSPADMYDVNTVGTTNLLEALKQARPAVRRIILASSSQVYGNASSTELDEEVPCFPVGHYACSKLAMEHMAATYRDDLRIVITRPFNYTGPGQPVHFLVPKIIDHYARGETEIELGNLEIVRDFSDVRSVVDAYCRLLIEPCEGRTFNICSGTGRSLRWLLEETGRLLGRSLEVKVRPEFVRSSDVQKLIGRNQRLIEVIGPLTYLDFTDTLRWMLEAAGVSMHDSAKFRGQSNI